MRVVVFRSTKMHKAVLRLEWQDRFCRTSVSTRAANLQTCWRNGLLLQEYAQLSLLLSGFGVQLLNSHLQLFCIAQKKGDLTVELTAYGPLDCGEDEMGGA